MKRVFLWILCLFAVFTMVFTASAAEIGNVGLYCGDSVTYYDTVEEALASANGGTVVLLQDVSAGQVIVPKNVTLNLNGFTLTADTVIVFNGEVTDPKNYGKIVVDQDMLCIMGGNNGKLPVWNPEGNCYTFASTSYQQLVNVAADRDSAQYIFIPNFDLATLNLLRNGSADNGISVKVLLSWNGGACQQTYTFTDELIAQVYSSANAQGVCAKVFMLTVTGVAGIEDMTVCAIVESSIGGRSSNTASKIVLTDSALDLNCDCSTDSADANADGVCDICNKHIHSYEASVTVPTCTQKGYTTYTCNCGDNYIADEIAALGHTQVITSGVEPTCTEEGITEGLHCSVCNAILVKQEIIPAAHNFDSQICTLCGEHQYLVFTLLENDTYSIKARDIEAVPTTLILPSTYNGKPVTQIARNAFAYCKTIERLLIPESIKRIDWDAFRDCENISQIVFNATECEQRYEDNIRWMFIGAGSATDGITVTIGANVKRIPPYLFSADDNLDNAIKIVSVEFIEGSVCEEIGFSAFEMCTSLKSVILPDSVTNIDIGAFFNCSSLESVAIPVGVTTLPHQVFTNCYNLTDVYYGGSREQWQEISVGAWNDPLLSAKIHYASTKDEYFNFTMLDNGTYCISAKDRNNMPEEVILPSSYNELAVTKIEDDAFYGCSSLTSIIIPSSITTIGDYAFSNCKNLTSVNFASGLTDIGYGAFSSCIALSGITIPDSVIHLGDQAFYACSSLTGVRVPNGLLGIPTGLFEYCYNLHSVLIPAEINYIAQNAFNGCTELENIYFKGSETQWRTISIGNGNEFLSNAMLTCKQVLTPTPDEYFVFTLLDDGTYSIRAKSTENIPSEVVIPASYNGKAVTVIEKWAFCPSGSQLDVNIITSIVIPDSIVKIEMAAFSECINLKSITIPENVTILEMGAFQGCTNLNAIYLPYNLQSIYDVVFAACHNLTDIYYMGTEEEWQGIGIGAWNDPLDNQTVSVHYNSMYHNGYWNESES